MIILEVPSQEPSQMSLMQDDPVIQIGPGVAKVQIVAK
jgi:hypothetical protein